MFWSSIRFCIELWANQLCDAGLSAALQTASLITIEKLKKLPESKSSRCE